MIVWVLLMIDIHVDNNLVTNVLDAQVFKTKEYCYEAAYKIRQNYKEIDFKCLKRELNEN
jgi:hypothetical protein